jgi:hypothetical protein
MISKSFDILTPLAKIHRISRKIADMDEFNISPGYWVDRDGMGDIVNFKSTTTTVTLPALCLSAYSSSDSFFYDGLSAYTSHDTKLGRITVIEESGIRCHFGLEYFIGAIPNVGQKLAVLYGDSINIENNGKMKVIDPTVPGTYMAVAKCTSKDGDLIEITTMEPTEIVIS